MKQRLITAACLLVLLALVAWQIYTPALVFLVAIFSAIATKEIMDCAKIKNKVIRLLGVTFSFFTPFFASASVLEPWVEATKWDMIINSVDKKVFIIILALAFFLAMLKDYENTKFEDVAIALVSTVVVPFGFSLFVTLRDISGFKTQNGVFLIFYALICALGTDTGAQLGGMAFGKTKMCPKISPKKTMEGAFSGVVTSLVLNAIAIMLYNKFALYPLLPKETTILMIAAPFISFMSMMGDLTASVLKRNFDVKDFGNIFPGHGGVMDRFDSSMFTFPLTYVVALVIGW